MKANCRDSKNVLKKVRITLYGKAIIDTHQLCRLALIWRVVHMDKSLELLTNMSFSRKLFGKLRNPNIQSTLVVAVMVI